MSAKKCATCKAYHAMLEGAQCRIRSPKPTLIMAQTLTGAAPQVVGMWPSVSPTDWCLEYQPNLTITH